MDDPKIVYSAPDKLEATLAELKQLGVDRIRVSVFWQLLAPDPRSQTRPFPAGGGADPSNYSAEKWDRYDRIVTTAERLGLKLLFNPTSPAPHWATSAPDAELENHFRPSPGEFRDFVKAVGTRYSGTFADEAPRQESSPAFDPCLPTPNFPLPPDLCPPDSTDPDPDNPNPPNTGPLLPRVDTWSIWNEPNMPGWLTPQSHEDHKRLAASPHVYRELADAMYSGLHETGHGGDTVLIAETAPRGAFMRGVLEPIPPLRFVRELYCVDRRFRPFRGGAAARRNCPTDGRGFREAHPVLFDTTGFAHHPYAFDVPPGRPDTRKDHVVMVDLGRLTRTLDRLMARYGSSRRLPVWITEYGYQTDPPDPYAGWPWKAHARFLSHAEWLAYKHRRVRSTAQFLLYDDAPKRDVPPSDRSHWGTFQTGLRTAQGEQKPAYESYQRGIHVVKRPRPGRPARVFGYFRAAPGKTPARIEFRRRGGKRWRVVKEVETNAHGYLLTKVAVRRAGTLRIDFGGETSARTRAARVGGG